MYKIFFHEIIPVAIEDNFDETHIDIFKILLFNFFLTGLCCSSESKKERCLERIASARWFLILLLWIDDKLWLNDAHAPAIADDQSLLLIVLNKSWVLERTFVDWAFYNFIIEKKKISVKIKINN